jgi:hypothetical protein
MMPPPYRIILLGYSLLFFSTIFGQRTNKPSSVLAAGNWYKIAVDREGIYKLDMSFLNSLGIQGAVPSSQVRLYGNGGAMLAEANSVSRIDDLEENSIWIEDGGDGQLNGSDYILFYAPGPDQWVKDSVNQRFSHIKNLYSDKAYYFLTVGGSGKRIPGQQPSTPGSTTVTTFNERYFHEQDTINFLNSGKEWYGEELSALPGRSTTRSFGLPFSDLLINQQATLITDVVARSVNVSSGFAVSVNGQPVQQVTIPPITTNIYDLFAQEAKQVTSYNPTVPGNQLTLQYNPGSVNSQGWLNWFEFFCRRNLSISPGKQVLFRDWSSVGNASVRFSIANADPSTIVWDITDPLNPVKMNTVFSNGSTSFSNEGSRLREYAASSNYFLVPQAIGRIANQNLHASTDVDLLIITDPAFVTEAKRLADFHLSKHRLKSVIATTEQVFNEFAGGSPDPTALRDYVKMYYDRYRSSWSGKGKYVLLFGKGSFDYKSRVNPNTNLVPVYETVSSLDPLSTYTSDDFFGFLDDTEDINSTIVLNDLDVGIGRIPFTTIEEAKNFVDKEIDYHSPVAFGNWRNNLNFIADDEDNNLHLQDAESLTATVATTAPVFNYEKIYLDAFKQESGSAGGRYPEVNALVNSNIYSGTLIWNYTGHGGSQRLAEEVVIDQSIVNSWNNRYRLPLFITATCDFAPYDNPYQESIGENLVVRPKTGAIALMTTSRVVFAFSNRIMNDNYLRIGLQRDPNGRYKSLGQAVLQAKNYTYQNSGDINNNRKFSLIGDPAMTIAFPVNKVVATAINGKSVISTADTVRATEFISLDGEVQSFNGSLLNTYNGTASVSVFDKPTVITTLGNDPTSIPVKFTNQQNILFKGKASVQNGKFTVQFKMPKDINYQFGAGKISLYATDSSTDGNGYTTNIIVGGISTTTTTDNTGPQIKAYLNSESFVNGSITNSNPILIVHLFDSSGINTGTGGIDHDLIATLDNDNKTYYSLNNFYETELDSYEKGSVHFQLPVLSPGHHSLKIKAWDVMNNSSEYVLDFLVVPSGSLQIDHVLNYPNPFTTSTTFWFEHNYPGVNLNVKIEIFTVTGKLIKTISQTINSPGNRSSEVQWDGTDDYGTKPGRGVYVYRVRVKTPNGSSAEKWERLVLLN